MSLYLLQTPFLLMVPGLQFCLTFSSTVTVWEAGKRDLPPIFNTYKKTKIHYKDKTDSCLEKVLSIKSIMTRLSRFRPRLFSENSF